MQGNDVDAWGKNLEKRGEGGVSREILVGGGRRATLTSKGERSVRDQNEPFKSEVWICLKGKGGKRNYRQAGEKGGMRPKYTSVGKLKT